jgi:hypothetical protein
MVFTITGKVEPGNSLGVVVAIMVDGREYPWS